MVMKVYLIEINEAFNDLIQNKKSREEIAFWASQRLFADDSGNLEFSPKEEEEKIWEAIKYLMGVDLLDNDGSYLHSIDNFIDFRKEINV
jgi:hypothetical protein